MKALVSFPLPAVTLCDEEAKDSGHCEDDAVLGLKFETWIDGRLSSPVKSFEQVVAGDDDDLDHSALLAKFGLSRIMEGSNYTRISNLPEPSRVELEKAGLLHWRTWCKEVLWTEMPGGDGTRRYLFKGTDITDKLRAMNYSCPSYPQCTGHVNRLSESDKVALSQRGWIVLSPQRDPIPSWGVKKSFYWDQEFKPGIPVRVKHAYKPILGHVQHSIGALSEGPIKKAYCIDSVTLAGLRRRNGPPSTDRVSVYRNLRYILKSARSWSGPIRSFELTIRKADRKEIISTCFDGLRRVDELTFRASLKDFTPKEDISVLFF